MSTISMTLVLAYLDPGTGSFMLQVMMAGLLSGMYVVSQHWRNLKAFVFGSSRTEK